MRSALLLLALAASAAAQTTPTLADTERAGSDASDLARAALVFRTALADSVSAEPADSASAEAWAAVVALRRSSAALGRGALALVAAEGGAVLFERAAGGERWLVAFNGADVAAFLPLPDGRPEPWTPAFASRAADVPGLVALLGDDDVAYGLRVPARTAVVYRPAAPGDVRPRGLDE